jgi:hypothetical protein
VDLLHVYTKLPNNGNDDSITLGLPSLNGSLVYKTTPKLTNYFTYNFSRNTAGAEGNGGGYLLTRDNGFPGFVPTSIDGASYRTPAELYELGSKLSLMNGKLFVGAALYDQSFTRRPQGSPPSEYNIRGVELELNYQPNKNFYGTVSYGYIHGTNSSDSFEAMTTNPASPEVVSAGSQFPGDAGKLRIQGLPHNQFNALASYTFDNGFGMSVNGTVASEINQNQAGTLIIPWQFQIDASAFYTIKQWSFRLAVLNLTDEMNWAPPNAVYGNESILLEPGIRGQFSVAYRF